MFYLPEELELDDEKDELVVVLELKSPLPVPFGPPIC